MDRVQTIAYPAPDSRPRSRDAEPLAPHVIVLFGATGDLAKRKLLPGMAYLAQSSLAPDIRVVGTAMDDIDTDEFRALARRAVESFGTHKIDDVAWQTFADRLTYVPQGAGPEGLTAAVKEAEALLGPGCRRLHYLSVPPEGGRGRHRDAARRGADGERPGRHGEAVRARPRPARCGSTTSCTRCSTSRRSSASTTSSARRRRRTSSRSASRTACSSRSGTATSSTTSRSTSPRPSGWTSGRASTSPPAPTRTWSSPTSCR